MGSNHTLTWPGSSASGVLTNDGAGNLSWGAGSGACGAAGLIQYSGGSGVFDCESALSYNEGTNVLTATTMEAINFNAIAGGGFSAADASGNIVATMSVQNVGYDRGLLTLTDDTATNSTIISELLVQSAQISAQRSASGLDGRFVIEEAGGGSDITILAPAIAAPYNLDLPNVNPANGTVTCGGGTHVSVLVLQDGWVMQVGCS